MLRLIEKAAQYIVYTIITGMLIIAFVGTFTLCIGGLMREIEWENQKEIKIKLSTGEIDSIEYHTLMSE